MSKKRFISFEELGYITDIINFYNKRGEKYSYNSFIGVYGSNNNFEIVYNCFGKIYPTKVMWDNGDEVLISEINLSEENLFDIL